MRKKKSFDKFQLVSQHCSRSYWLNFIFYFQTQTTVLGQRYNAFFSFPFSFLSSFHTRTYTYIRTYTYKHIHINTLEMSSNTEQQAHTEPLVKTDTLVHSFEGHADTNPELTRVVLICLDPESAGITFQWALDNFVCPKKDLVSVMYLRFI